MDNNTKIELTAEELEILRSKPELAEELVRRAFNRAAHREHKLYREAVEMFTATHRAQIDKGAEKYPEPLNPDSWTMHQLIDHSMQEVADQVNYLTALKIKLDDSAAGYELKHKVCKEIVKLSTDYRNGRINAEYIAERVLELSEGLSKASANGFLGKTPTKL